MCARRTSHALPRPWRCRTHPRTERKAAYAPRVERRASSMPTSPQPRSRRRELLATASHSHAAPCNAHKLPITTIWLAAGHRQCEREPQLPRGRAERYMGRVVVGSASMRTTSHTPGNSRASRDDRRADSGPLRQDGCPRSAVFYNQCGIQGSPGRALARRIWLH
jgi:hypothetical protein